MECKGQAIDPQRHPQNFVEIFEITDHNRYEGGFQRLAALLEMSEDGLAALPVWVQKTRRRDVVGRPSKSVDVAIESFVGSAATIYVNNVSGRHIYVYRRNELMAAIKKAIPQGLLRGVGKSNDETFAVKIPLADRRWSRGDDFVWKWRGVGVETDAIESLQELLSPSA